MNVPVKVKFSNPCPVFGSTQRFNLLDLLLTAQGYKHQTQHVAHLGFRDFRITLYGGYFIKT